MNRYRNTVRRGTITMYTITIFNHLYLCISTRNSLIVTHTYISYFHNILYYHNVIEEDCIDWDWQLTGACIHYSKLLHIVDETNNEY